VNRGAAGPDRDLEVATKLARWMDGRLLDPLIGFFLPGVGDVASAALGIYPVWLAWRRGAPKVLIARMLLNLSVDLLGGLIPVVGDIWDFFFRAHSRNLELLRDRRRVAAATGDVLAPRATARDWLVVVGAALVFLGALAVPVLLVIFLGRSLRH
jgi:Domain of unknown function (DUF4112)